jgi:hypothetical protein
VSLSLFPVTPKNKGKGIENMRRTIGSDGARKKKIRISLKETKETQEKFSWTNKHNSQQ